MWWHGSILDTMTSTDDREAGRQRLEVATLERMKWKPHNHTTRHLRPQGQCPACDQIHATLNEGPA